MPDLAQINKHFLAVQSKDPGWIDRITIRQRNKLANEYRTAYREVDRIIAGLYAKIDNLTYAEMMKYGRMLRLQKSIFEKIRETDPTVRNIIYDDIALEYLEAYNRKAYGIETSIETDIGFQKLSPAQIQNNLAKRYDFKTIKENLRINTARINANVNHSITQGLIQGKGYAEMTRNIKENFNRGFKDAYRITRTEGHRARELGNLDAAEEAEKRGVKTRGTWNAVFDMRTRVTHGDMHGRQRDENGYFHLPGGVTAIAPGMSGVAEHDINCRCTVTNRVTNFAPKYKRVKGKGIVTQKTAFKEWKKIKKMKQ